MKDYRTNPRIKDERERGSVQYPPHAAYVDDDGDRDAGDAAPQHIALKAIVDDMDKRQRNKLAAKFQKPKPPEHFQGPNAERGEEGDLGEDYRKLEEMVDPLTGHVRGPAGARAGAQHMDAHQPPSEHFQGTDAPRGTESDEDEDEKFRKGRR